MKAGRKGFVRAACKEVGLNESTYWKRRRKGMSHEEALNTPVPPSLSRTDATYRASVRPEDVTRLFKLWRRPSNMDEVLQDGRNA